MTWRGWPDAAPQNVLVVRRWRGVSSGAVVHVARRLADELEEGVVVCVLADGGWRYLSADFWSAPDVERSMEAHVWW